MLANWCASSTNRIPPVASRILSATCSDACPTYALSHEIDSPSEWKNSAIRCAVAVFLTPAFPVNT